jgi:hypothetical protein
MGPRTLHAPTRATRGTAHRARVPCDRSPTTRPRSATWIWCSRRNAAHPGSQRQGEPRGAALGLVGQVEPARAQRLELDGAALDVPHVGVRLR